MRQEKLLFIDRDGTLIKEPDDCQIDKIEKLVFMPNVIPFLLRLKNAGYKFVMVSNQDGLGTQSFRRNEFLLPHELMMNVFESQGIIFETVRICPHKQNDNCDCRKPKVGLVLDYLAEQKIDRNCSFVIGDRETDMLFAKNLGIQGIQIGKNETLTWLDVANRILARDRIVFFTRKSNETNIEIKINLDSADEIKVDTGIGFFNHMLEQLAKHGGFSLTVKVQGDLEIDDHHTVEDTAICLGEAMNKALNNKWGIARYGFMLPMDEALAQVAIDLSGRAYFIFNGKFDRQQIGDLSIELIPHFFRSFAEGLKANLHINVTGENTHHMIESIFKCVGRALRQAIEKIDTTLPTTKGVL